MIQNIISCREISLQSLGGRYHKEYGIIHYWGPVSQAPPLSIARAALAPRPCVFHKGPDYRDQQIQTKEPRMNQGRISLVTP